jgi:phosphotransferase system  glucose/maltose/N-acetylglucosamine-specific IIC component
MVMVPSFLGLSPWTPLHMIGAIALGPSAMASPDTFDLKIVSVAVVLHMALAILYAVILAFIVARMEMGPAILVGAVYGLVLYGINFYGFTKWFPWWADHRDWVAIFTHVVQGALWAWLYRVWAARNA